VSSSNPNAPRNPVKRPSDSNQSSSALKKAKPSDASASATVKRESNAGTPPVRKLTKGESSNSKSSAVVKKSPSSFKNNKKLKMKTKKNSQFSKSSRVPPGSGDGKKWSTLEHNGVIFPPPYSPHGVKMLYNGQPVELTPAEEEVKYMPLAVYYFGFIAVRCSGQIMLLCIYCSFLNSLYCRLQPCLL
jgi:DNA topoisomerase-1